MKKILLLTLMLFLLALTSCANVDISYHLSDDNVVTLDYSLEITSGEANMKGYANTITDYWESMDFITDVDTDGDKYVINGEKSVSSGSKESAAQEFSSLITQDESAFSDVEFYYLPSFEMDKYSLSAKVSLENVIRQNEMQNILPDDIDFLQDNAKSGEYKLSLSLPGDVVSTNAHEQNDNVCTWNLEFGKVTQISIDTEKINDENIEYYARLKKDYDNDVMIFTILGIAGVALILAVIITLIVRHMNKKKSKFNEKQF